MMDIGAQPRGSPWHAPASAQPLIAWRDAQLGALVGALGQALHAWRADWGLASVGAIRCSVPGQVEPGGNWQGLMRAAEPGGWLQVDADPAQLGAALFGAGRPSGPIAHQLAVDCQRDLLGRLLAVMGLTFSSASADAGPAAADTGPWSGTVEVGVDAPVRCRLLLRAAVLADWLVARGDAGGSSTLTAARPALTPPLQAAGDLPVRLSIALAGCDIDLGSLRSLDLGDVVCTRHRIDVPADVCAADGAILFQAYLGRRADDRAVALASPASLARSPTAQEMHP